MASACLSENQIVRFFDPRQRAAVAGEVDAHTATCDKCRRLLAEYADIAAADTSITQPHDPRGFTAALPSLTPANTTDVRNERLERVQRLAQMQARKHIGEVLKGKWEIEQLIGTGGMAHVFAARHRNGRRVAIKTMRPELVLERSLVERFLREGYVANKIEHEGAVAILDDDVMEDGTPFIVMELLEGRTLRERLDIEGPMPVAQALRATSQVLDVLAVAHEKGIVHRDLKPDNLFETKDGKVKILDFGIARLKERARPELETRSGLTMGTIGYMPPEQARGLATQVDARSDVWAIGATLYSLLTGKRLQAEAETTNEALLLAMTSPVPKMASLIPSLAPRIQEVLDTSLAFDKAQRFPSARAMKEALDSAMLGIADTIVVSAPPALVSVAQSNPHASQPITNAPTKTKSRAPMVMGAASLLVIALGGGSYYATSVRSTTTPTPAAESTTPAAIISESPPTPAPTPTPTPTPVVASSPPSASSSAAPPPVVKLATKPAAPPKPKATTATATATPTAAPLPLPAPTPSTKPVDTRDPLGPQH